MSRGTDIDGLLAVAIRDEQSGRVFYRRLGELAEESAVRELFGWLSDQEEIHTKRFVELSKQLEETNPPEQYPDEYTGYVEWLVSSGGSSSLREDVGTCKTDADRVALAIGFEREQLSLLQDLASFISGEHQPIVNEVIDEERGHIVRLSAQQKTMGQ